MTSTQPSTEPATVRITGPAARTDVAPAPVPGPREPDRPRDSAVRVAGVGLVVGAGSWVALMPYPQTVLGAASAVAFQLSLLGLLAVMWRTRATGARRLGRVLLAVEAVVLALATVQSITDAMPGAVAATLAWNLDLTWPLSMLGMLVTGVTVACVGRWRGAARLWTPVATSWIVFLPVMTMVPISLGGFVAGGHVMFGYVVLGAILAVRPGSTRR